MGFLTGLIWALLIFIILEMSIVLFVGASCLMAFVGYVTDKMTELGQEPENWFDKDKLSQYLVDLWPEWFD